MAACSDSSPALDLSALSGKIKLVLSSFPQWDVQPSPAHAQRSSSDFEPPQAVFVLGRQEQCQPAVVVAQQDALSESSSSSSDSSDFEPSRTDQKADELPLVNIPAHTEKPPALSPTKTHPPVPTLQPAAREQPLGRMMVVTSQPLLREPNAKVPIMVTKSEDLSQARREVTQGSAKQSVPEHRSRSVCSGCAIW